MKIQATLKIRNGALIEARKSLGLSQRNAAKEAGISPWFLMRLETLNFPNISPDDERLIKLCAFLKLEPDELFPEELAGKSIQNKFVSTAKVNAKNLLAYSEAYNSRMLLPSPMDEAEVNDQVELIKKYMEKLSYREREILKLLFGLDDNGQEYTREEVARMLRSTRNRVRQIEYKAIKKIRTLAENEV